MKKLIALVLALAMVLMAASALAVAQTTQTGTITVTNAAKGIHYNIYKLLDATVDGDAIAYTYGTDGVLPGNLATYYPHIEDTVNNVEAAAAAADSSDATKLSTDAIAALKTWLTTATVAAPQATGDGNAVSWSNLGYGYYIITSDQGDEGKITVVTLNADNVNVVDKNTTEPDIDKYVADGTTTGENGTEINWTESRDAFIGASVQYKILVSTTTNWHEPYGGGDQKQVKEYVVGDNLANNNLVIESIDSIKVGGTTITLNPAPTAFPITIPWVKNNGTEDAPEWESLYNNGVSIEIIYTAHLADGATIDTVAGNVNTADLDWDYVDGEPHFGDGHDHLKDEAHTETYGIAFVKVNENGEYLSGAEFQLPFYVKSTPDATDGAYIYAGTTAGEGLTNTVTTPENGAITIKGLEAGSYSITETKAPAGYNKLADPVSITAVKLSSTTDVTETHMYWKIDENGDVVPGTYEERTESKHFEYNNDEIGVTAITVLNTTGTVLPSTGGIGTTIFYIVGGILLIGAAVILVARRKAHD